jgi:hypothetical protein
MSQTRQVTAVKLKYLVPYLKMFSVSELYSVGHSMNNEFVELVEYFVFLPPTYP